MANVFDSLLTYGEKWQKTGERAFTDAEKSAIASATVTAGEFGKSVCFVMKAGGTKYIPLSNTSFANVGDTVNMDNAKLITLYRNGDGNRLRVEI